MRGLSIIADVVLPCEENERGTQSEKNARCGRTREKKKKSEANPRVEIFV